MQSASMAALLSIMQTITLNHSQHFLTFHFLALGSLLPRAIVNSFPLPSRLFLLWVIAFHPALMIHEKHFSFSNAFLLQSSPLMLSASPIHSAILLWKCDVSSRDTQIFPPPSYFLMPLGMKNQGLLLLLLLLLIIIIIITNAINAT